MLLNPVGVETVCVTSGILTFHYGAIEHCKCAKIPVNINTLTFHYGAIEP